MCRFKHYFVLLVAIILSTITGCATIEAESEVLTQRFSDSLPNVQHYYSYESGEWDEKTGDYKFEETVGIARVEKRKNTFVLTFPLDDAPPVVLRVKHVNGSSYVGQMTFMTVQKKQVILLFPLEVFPGGILFYGDVDHLVDLSRLQSTPLEGRYKKDDHDLLFDKVAATRYKQQIVTYLNGFQKENFNVVYKAKPLSDDEALLLIQKAKVEQLEKKLKELEK